jgi:hypothetical protein
MAKYLIEASYSQAGLKGVIKDGGTGRKKIRFTSHSAPATYTRSWMLLTTSRRQHLHWQSGGPVSRHT